MTYPTHHHRGITIDITEQSLSPNTALVAHLTDLDLIYRSLCAVLYNYVPTSGHPGGSISSGRIISSLLFHHMNYDLSDPNRLDADIISYAAGHKALGLYAMWALRNEIACQSQPELLPSDIRQQLRLEDLLGFRHNPTTATPLFNQFNSKALDGHPTPATPFVKLATGASGVGLATSLGLAFAAKDYYRNHAPKVHIIEGEGGLTPGRVSESLASAATSGLNNAILHIDWNQSSIDSDAVCRENTTPGDYVQWTPMELCEMHDWNVIYVPDGKNMSQVLNAQEYALSLTNSQPTAIVYRTIKGWQYGIEGKSSHGGGHGLCSDNFYESIRALWQESNTALPTCEDSSNCNDALREQCFWKTLSLFRNEFNDQNNLTQALGHALLTAQKQLNDRARCHQNDAPDIDAIYTIVNRDLPTPEALMLEPGKNATLRGQLGKVLGYLNMNSQGAILAASADLLGSTNTNTIGSDFDSGFFHASTNAGARLLSTGGICEDAMCGILSGISTFSKHIGVGSSYSAFIAALSHITARLHAIGNQYKQHLHESSYNPMIITCAHAGLKTGEDGPTHADPQALQLFQENFPKGTSVTLTPWDPQEVWPLIRTALRMRPAVIAPFVTRPSEAILDRANLGLANADKAIQGVYRLLDASDKTDISVVLQGSGIAYEFIQTAWPKLKKQNLPVNVYYIASAELFDQLDQNEQDQIFPYNHRKNAMGITGFTLPTMYRWILSDTGRTFSMHPFQNNTYLGSGPAHMVLGEAGLDGLSQYKRIKSFIENS